MQRIARSQLLEGLLGRQTAAVLSVLLARPEARLYQRQIAQLAGVRLLQAQRALRALADVGVLRAQHEGNRVYYSSDPACPILPELTAIVLKTAGVVDVLRTHLGGLPGVAVAFIYGSVARMDQRPESDVDLMIVGDVSMRDLVTPLRHAEEAMAREVNPTLYPQAEFRQKLGEKHHFLTAVMAEPKLFVIGDADVIERMARAGVAESAQDKPTGGRRPARSR